MLNHYKRTCSECDPKIIKNYVPYFCERCLKCYATDFESVLSFHGDSNNKFGNSVLSKKLLDIYYQNFQFILIIIPTIIIVTLLGDFSFNEKLKYVSIPISILIGLIFFDKKVLKRKGKSKYVSVVEINKYEFYDYYKYRKSQRLKNFLCVLFLPFIMALVVKDGMLVFYYTQFCAILLLLLDIIQLKQLKRISKLNHFSQDKNLVKYIEYKNKI